MSNASSLTIEKCIRDFFAEDPFFQESIPPSLDAEFDLMENGHLDSIGIFTLIVFLESTFHISIEIRDLAAHNFSSLAKIVRFVESRTEPAHELSP